jgi:hypothetical protein
VVEEQKAKPTKEQFNAAFEAKNVALFEALVKQCGEDELALIQEFTQKAASSASNAQRELFALSGKYEDMMIAGLKRLVDLSTLKTGLQTSDILDLTVCFDVISNFRLKSNIKNILMHPNPEGYSFCSWYLSGHYEFMWRHIKIYNVRRDLYDAFWAGLNADSNLHDVERFAKSGLIDFEVLFNALLKFFPIEKIEGIFEDIPFHTNLVSYTLERANPPLFKFLINKNKLGNYDYHLVLWVLITSPKAEIEKVKCLLKNQTTDWFFLFHQRNRHPDGLWNIEAKRIVGEECSEAITIAIDFIVKHKLTDYKGLQALCTRLMAPNSSADLRLGGEYLKLVLERMEQQAAVTVAGINRFRHHLFPVFNDVVRQHILPKIFDPRIGFEQLKSKLMRAILRADIAEINRLVKDRKIDVNRPYLGARTLLRYALTDRRARLPVIVCLVEQCGSTFTLEDISIAGRYSEQGRYLCKMQAKKAITLLGIFKFNRDHALPLAAKPSSDTVRLIAQKVVGKAQTALDLNPNELPDVRPARR